MIRTVLIAIPPLVHGGGESDPDPSRPDFETRRLVSPVEPTVVGADLLGRGYDVRLFDLGVYPDDCFGRLDSLIAETAPDAVVMVQSVLTFATAQDWDGREVFDLARRHDPGTVTVLTGNTATNYPGKAVGEGVCDYSIRGEVDFAVGDLLDALNENRPLKAIDGLSYRDAASATVVDSERYPNVDVAALPLPAYGLLDEEHRRRYGQILETGKIRYPAMSPRYRDIVTSRSCTLRCSFCSVAHLRGGRQKHRRKPLSAIRDEIAMALDEGIGEIHFFDDLFARNEADILDFTDMLARESWRFPWFIAQGQPLWPITRDALGAMAETGMYRLIAPFESGSDRVLREVVGKIHSTVAHHSDVARWSRELGLELIGMFVVGMIGETRREILDTVLFARDHGEIDYRVFSIATPMVGTRLMAKTVRGGQLKDRDAINRVIKRTVALYDTDAFDQYEMGVIRAFDWDRQNFPTLERRLKYARMVGLSLEQLDLLREHSKRTFYRFFPDYDGPLSFLDLFDEPGMFAGMKPKIPAAV